MDSREVYNLLSDYVSKIQRESPLKYSEEDLEKFEVSKKRVSLAPIKLKNGDIYAGEWTKQQIMEGEGLMIKAGSGKVFDGIWKDGEIVHGRIFYPGEIHYEGEISNEVPNGRGILNMPKICYKGEFMEGKKHGQGAIHFADGTRFIGTFQNDNAINGIILWPQGCSYEGEVTSFSLGPKGLFTTVEGNTYEGFWFNNKFEGLGTFSWKNHNQVYEGNYRKNKKEGHGIYYFNYPNVFYKGNWLHDKPHGHGEYQTENKTTVGLWRFGKLVQIYSEAQLESINSSEENQHKPTYSAEEELNFNLLKEDVNTNDLPNLKHETEINPSPFTVKFKPVNVSKEISTSMVQLESVTTSPIIPDENNYNQTLTENNKNSTLGDFNQIHNPRTSSVNAEIKAEPAVNAQ
jgi:hypothetical protein